MSDASPHLTFENAAGHLRLEPAGYVHVIWHQTDNSQLVRNLLNQALELLAVSCCGRMLIDHRQTAPYLEADCVWLLTDWFPQCRRRTQYSYGAILAPRNLFVRLAVSSFGQQVQQLYGVHYHYFEANQQELAKAWLVAQPS